MHDPNILRKQPQWISQQLLRRGYQFSVEQFTHLEEQRKQLDVEVQQLRNERNMASKQIGILIKDRGLSKEQAKAEVADVLQRVEQRLSEARKQAEQIHTQLRELNLDMPNIPGPEVPHGDSEQHNRILSEWGQPPQFDFSPRSHIELGDGWGIDTDTATLLAGARFMVLRGAIAQLHRALISYMMNLHTAKGYTEYYVPYIANTESLTGTCQLPKFADDLFMLSETRGWYLIPTAEVALTNIFRNSILESSGVEQAIKMVAHTPCFRSEAGSYGRDVSGIIRQHQFEKVELVILCKAEQSATMLETLTADAEAVLQGLQLPYRKVELCCGDLGFAARHTYDLEVWMPGQQKYREISSCSEFGDFQTRRLKIRWKNPQSGRNELLHSLNGSGVAVGRCLAAIVENYQREDGNITVPEVLTPFLDNRKILNPGPEK